MTLNLVINLTLGFSTLGAIGTQLAASNFDTCILVNFYLDHQRKSDRIFRKMTSCYDTEFLVRFNALM